MFQKCLRGSGEERIKMLYSYGDECTTLTGGWSNSGYSWYNSTYGGAKAGTKNADNLYVKGASDTVYAFGTQKKISLSGYSKICMVVTTSSMSGVILTGSTSKALKNPSNTKFGFDDLPTSLNKGTVTYDISSINDEVYIALATLNWAQRNANLYQVYLEK